MVWYINMLREYIFIILFVHMLAILLNVYLLTAYWSIIFLNVNLLTAYWSIIFLNVNLLTAYWSIIFLCVPDSRLLSAAEAGDAESVSGFLASGADVNWQNEHGETALIYASWAGHEAVVATLLHHPATVANLQVRFMPSS